MKIDTGERFTLEDFRRRANRESASSGGFEYGDHLMNPDFAGWMRNLKLRDAAVLVPVVDRVDGPTVILTQRATALRNHAGQIAFPGGRIDPEDRSPEDAALREAFEEIGLERQFIDIAGRLPDYVSGSGYRIAPVLATVRRGFRFQTNPDEVDDVFEVPLRFLMDPANHHRGSRVWENKERFFLTMPFGDYNIWGVTAGIIHTVYQRLYG